MIKILISLEDKVMTDVVKTAFKQFPNITAYPVPPHKLLELVQEGPYHAVVVDMDNRREQTGGTVSAIRETNTSIEILTLIEEGQKDRFNRLKVDLDIFSCISLPLDPFELARRIVRLEKHLVETNPLAN